MPAHNWRYGDDPYLYYASVNIQVVICKPKFLADDQWAYGASGRG